MGLDIHSALVTAVVLLSIAWAFFLVRGFVSLAKGRQTAFYRIRAQRISSGWRLLLTAFVLALFALFLLTKGESAAYKVFPPSPTLSRTPTITLTPTISLTPSITLTPTITLTPAVSHTPTPSHTPYVPDSIAAQFISTVTPPPFSVISPLEFSQTMQNAVAVDPGGMFTNPVGHLYAVFSYDQMVPGVQWTAIWYYEGAIVHFETKPWDGGTGGYGFTDWNPDPHIWLPGEYQVVIFVGNEFRTGGNFAVVGDAPTAASP